MESFPTAKLNEILPGNEKIPLRVAFAHNPPDVFDDCLKFPTLTATFECPYPGWTTEILKEVADYIGAEIIPIDAGYATTDVDWGTKYENGTWTGMLGYIQNGTVDTIALMYQMTDERFADFGYSYNVYNVQPILVAKQLTNNLGEVLFNNFKTYDYTVWVTMVAMFIVQCIYSIFVARVEVSLGWRKVFDPGNIVWKYVGTQLLDPSQFYFYSAAGNLTLLVFSFIQARILMSLYSAFLLSSILKSASTAPFVDADGAAALIATGNYHLITDDITNYFFDDLAHSEDEFFIKLRVATKDKPIYVTDTVATALQYVERGGYIYPIQVDSSAMRKAKQHCDLVFVSDGLPQKVGYFVFHQNNTKLMERFNVGIIMSSGFIRRTYDKYFEVDYSTEEPPMCEKKTGFDGSNVVALSLATTLGTFCVLFIGWLGGGIALILEWQYKYHRDKIIQHLKARRAIAEPIHTIALAQYFAGSRLQTRADEQLRAPSPLEFREHITIADLGFPS